MKYIKAESAKANTPLVIRFDRHNHNFIVKETTDHNEGLSRQEYRIILPSRWCDCDKFQTFRMPCSYVIAAFSYTHQDVLQLLSPIYKSETLLNVYNNNFPLVAKLDYWPAYDGEIHYYENGLSQRFFLPFKSA